jgi:hypothetical protein
MERGRVQLQTQDRIINTYVPLQAGSTALDASGLVDTAIERLGAKPTT